MKTATGARNVANSGLQWLELTRFYLLAARTLCYAMSTQEKGKMTSHKHNHRKSPTSQHAQESIGPRLGNLGRDLKVCKRVDWKCERGEHRKNETRQPNGSSIAPITFPLHEEQHNEEDPIWQALAGIQIKISMQKRLNLVPHFWQSIEARVLKTTQPVITANPTESTEGPIVKHHHNPALKLIIKGQGVLGCLIDRGSDVNVISKSTCDWLGIQDWETCSFWLYMADTRLVWPLGLIRKLEIIVGGYTFDIWAMFLLLDASGAYCWETSSTSARSAEQAEDLIGWDWSVRPSM